MKRYGTHADVFRNLLLAAFILGVIQPRLFAQEQVRIQTEDSLEITARLRGPVSSQRAVLIVNPGSGGDKLAVELERRGIKSLLLDLPSSGDNWQDKEIEADAEKVVAAACNTLKDQSGSIAVFGAGPAAEEVAEAGHTWGFANAYVVVSPNTFVSESIQDMRMSGVPWLFVESSGDAAWAQGMSDQVRMFVDNVEMIRVPSRSVGTQLLSSRGDLPERIAAWIDARLR